MADGGGRRADGGGGYVSMATLVVWRRSPRVGSSRRKKSRQQTSPCSVCYLSWRRRRTGGQAGRQRRACLSSSLHQPSERTPARTAETSMQLAATTARSRQAGQRWATCMHMSVSVGATAVILPPIIAIPRTYFSFLLLSFLLFSSIFLFLFLLFRRTKPETAAACVAPQPHIYLSVLFSRVE